ncbi:Lectin BRA-2 [Amphibalanus amphitrite]|uniref:Lectin BRA-2 n=1 Tax=Amphibalanus amphitrite TaxID=1232801 RepID=A0A6A4WP10_AMPAM|nr:Lectin BRA-2 [Amphibalanus amphitrite]
MPLRAVSLCGALLLLAAAPTALGRPDVTLGDIVRNLTAPADSVPCAELGRAVEALQQQLTAAQSSGGQCPAGWSRHRHSCYLMPAVTATWFGASALCPAMDRRARLASVHNDNHQFVEELVASSDATYVWVGGMRLRKGGRDWGWQDGTPFDFTNWAAGQSTAGSELCLELQGPRSRHDARLGQWHDVICDGGPYHFLCQITLPTEVR